MLILSCLGGLSLEQSDLVRRSMSMQKLSSVKEWKGIFVLGNEIEGVPGSVKKGFDKDMAENI